MKCFVVYDAIDNNVLEFDTMYEAEDCLLEILDNAKAAEETSGGLPLDGVDDCWIAVKLNKDSSLIVHVEDGEVVGYTITLNNQRLRQSAPELYESLNWLVEVKDYKDNHGKDLAYEKAKETAWQRACEVLKKVRGEL